MTVSCLVAKSILSVQRIPLNSQLSNKEIHTECCRKAVITTRILGLVHELCVKRIHVTKRDLFYTDVKLFEVQPRALCHYWPPAMIWWTATTSMLLQEQGNSDSVLDDVACLLSCTRTSLHGMPWTLRRVFCELSVKAYDNLTSPTCNLLLPPWT